MEYTKGEWKASHPQDNHTAFVSDNNFQQKVLMSVQWGSDIPEIEQRANAQLISAAPDGLEAGIAAYIALLRTGVAFRIDIQRELCQLRDFIAKATNRDTEEVQNEYESQALAKAEGK